MEEPPDYARHEAFAVRFEEMVGDFDQRHVRSGSDQAKNLRSMVLDPSRAPIPALHTRLTGAGAPPVAHQFDRCRRRHTEPDGSASTTHALILHRPNDAKTKIQREGFGHAGWPPSPAPTMNHDLPREGIPSDSARSKNALALRRHRIEKISSRPILDLDDPDVGI